MRVNSVLVALSLSLLAGVAHAQSMAGMHMPGMAPPPAKAPAKADTPAQAQAAPATPSPAPTAEMPGMAMDHPAAHDGHDNMAGMDMGHMGHMSMSGNLGTYPMTRDATGTSWQPDSAKHEGLHAMLGPWTVMAHGEATLVYDNQGGPRGDTKTFIESMALVAAQRALGGGTLTLRAHGSLDPTIGKSGYPLLLQTGETADGVHTLVDRQHPHDLVDELSVTYSHPITATLGGFIYAAYPGEPALGPVTYLHRGSGAVSPETPIDHHWLDSTHVSFGVVTAGLVFANQFKLEASAFRGREPDQHRYDLETPALDSGSVRLTWNPTRDLSLQISQGWLHSSEQLDPNVNQRRTTASATYNRAWANRNWQTTLAWGQTANRPGKKLDAYLLESALSFGPHTVFGRAERANKDELFAAPSPLGGRAFEVGKLSLGYAYSIPVSTHFVIDLGGLVSTYDLPSALDVAYGRNPRSIMLFTRVKLR